MQALRIEKVIQSNRILVLENLPFEVGEMVEVIILEKQIALTAENKYPLRGTTYKYEEPFESASPLEDWEVL